MHNPVILKDISLVFSHKNCFEEFSTRIYPGSRTAIIGRNGSGKSSLLDIIRKQLSPSNGEVLIEEGAKVSYVPQIVEGFQGLSGSQRFHKKLSEAITKAPDILLLDEPTNHLDVDNKKSLMHMLDRYNGTLIIVTHDVQLLRRCVDILWHIENNKIQIFSGSYDDYIYDIEQKRGRIQQQVSLLKRKQQEAHNSLMKEQKRAAASKKHGQKSIDQKKWPTIVSKSKMGRAQQTSGKKKAAIDNKKEELSEQLSELNLPEIILPKFALPSCDIGAGNIVEISGADIGYSSDKIILQNVYLSIGKNQRVAICGKNASGKSTLLKAILDHQQIYKTGDWHTPSSSHIGYLDQHYLNLDLDISVIDHIKNLQPSWSEGEIRHHLSDFLFRKNHEVTQIAASLSGGEKVRLSLCMIAAKTPRVLILDEITNNLDIETRAHVIEVLKEYPGSMIVISHDEDFLQSIGIDHKYQISDKKVILTLD